MIDFIKGKLVQIGDDYVVMDYNGMGFRIYTSQYSKDDMSAIGEISTVHTQMIVREDNISLVGFSTHEELGMFQKLTSVSGVGTKVGIGILSSMHFTTVATMIATGDVKGLTQAQGVGKKTAERIVLELKDKVTASESASLEGIMPVGPVDDDAMEAMISLGYTKTEAQSLLNHMDTSGMTTEDIIKAALRKMMER